MPTFYEDLAWRGLIHQLTHPDELREKLNNSQLIMYVGFDPSADSFHIGSLVPLLMLVRFQRAGHIPIALMGGGTGLIGDPSFKAQERQLLTKDKLAENVAGMRAQMDRILDFSGGHGIMDNNAEWLCAFNLVDFLRDIGKHFSVNMMLEKESVKNRIEQRDQGISYTEFTYMLLQAYDFLHLYEKYNCTLQVGGSDQWGNITAGMDLIRRMRGADAYGLTHPLITKADGTKFGKTEKGNIWLDARRTSPYEFYQFFVRTDDRDVGNYLRMLSFLSWEEITELEKQVTEKPETRAVQKKLAMELTTMIHGAAEAERVESASHVLFGGSLDALDERTLLEIFAEVPSSTADRTRFAEEGVSIIDLLVESGLSASRGMARNDLKGGGIYLNNIQTAERNIQESDIILDRYLVLRKGKKSYHLMRVE